MRLEFQLTGLTATIHFKPQKLSKSGEALVPFCDEFLVACRSGGYAQGAQVLRSCSKHGSYTSPSHLLLR
jgi:hypothetical protein